MKLGVVHVINSAESLADPHKQPLGPTGIFLQASGGPSQLVAPLGCWDAQMFLSAKICVIRLESTENGVSGETLPVWSS